MLRDIFDHPSAAGAAGIAAKTAIVYAFLIIGLRWLGKRELGQMSLYDFVMVVVLGNAVQNAMLGTDTTLGGGLVAAMVLLLINKGVKTLVVLAVVATGLRLLGKRETSQLNVYDLAMLMALANAVQNAITGGKGNLAVGLVTSSVLVLVAWGVTKLIVHRPGLERAVVGSPTILIHRGTVLPDRLRRQGVSLNELRAATRASGISDLDRVHTCVLEVDGSISVILYPDAGQGHPEQQPGPENPDEPEEG
jgi:uncharacterized membrane protein YcaP (DUF421 family)